MPSPHGSSYGLHAERTRRLPPAFSPEPSGQSPHDPACCLLQPLSHLQPERGSGNPTLPASHAPRAKLTSAPQPLGVWGLLPHPTFSFLSPLPLAGLRPPPDYCPGPLHHCPWPGMTSTQMPPCPGQRPRARTQVTADLFTLFLTARSAVGDTVALCSAMLWGINYVRISWHLFPVYLPDHQHASSAPRLASALPGRCPSVANRAQERTAPGSATTASPASFSPTATPGVQLLSELLSLVQVIPHHR